MCGLKPSQSVSLPVPPGHTLRGCVDWNLLRTCFGFGAASHPAWVCGLKRIFRPWMVAQPWSHPAWVCGLKHTIKSKNRCIRPSHPAWVCGLKHRKKTKQKYWQSHPAWVCGLKQLLRTNLHRLISHTLRGCVDWNLVIAALPVLLDGHTLRGCVDWN